MRACMDGNPLRHTKNGTGMTTNLQTLLHNSVAPLFLLGAGSRNVSEEIISFAEKYSIPILTTWNAIDVVDYEHPNFMGRPGIVACRGGNIILQYCDLLIAIGARLDQSTIAFRYDKLSPRAKKVMVGTETGEFNKIAPYLDLAIQETSKEFIQKLYETTNELPDYSGWLKTCKELKNRFGVEGKTTTYQLCETLSKILDKDAVIVFSNSGTTGGAIFPAFFKQKKGQRIIMSSCGLGSMGSGIPAAIGTAIACKKNVVCVDGDGSFMQNVQELEVVRRLNLPITFFVVENGGYASIRDSEMRGFGRTAGADKDSGMTLPNIKAIVNAFGIPCNDYSPEPTTLYDGPRVFIVHSPHDEALIPRVIMNDGRGCLEDMFPYENS
jgi:acetolactate synthase I/II/III large subunit